MNFTPNSPIDFQTICQEAKNEVPKPELIEELESLLPFDSPSHDNSQILDLSQSLNSQYFETTQFAGLLEPMVELGEHSRFTVQTEPFFNIFQDHPAESVNSQHSWQLGQISPAYSNGASPLYNPEPALVVDPLGLTPPYEANNGESESLQILPVTVYQNCQNSQIEEFTNQNCQNSQVEEFTVQPYEKKHLVTKINQKVPKQMTRFKFYLDKLKVGPIVISWNSQQFTIRYDEFTSIFNNGNLLMLVISILEMCLGENLSGYTLTGIRQVKDPESGKVSRVSNAAHKLPEDLKVEIKNFILNSQLMTNYPEILADFDRYFKTILSKSLNRVQDKLRKRKDAAAKKQNLWENIELN